MVLPGLAFLFLIRGDYLSLVAGAALFHLYSILDGCDGEIARAKQLQTTFGERLDTFCDFIASLFFVIGLAIGLDRMTQGIICAGLITANESLLLIKRSDAELAGTDLDASIYLRHRGFVAHSGLLNFGEKFVWWLFQLTKRDVALFAFFIFAVIGRAAWILDLWSVVALGSVLLHGIALVRSGIRPADIGPEIPRT